MGYIMDKNFEYSTLKEEIFPYLSDKCRVTLSKSEIIAKCLKDNFSNLEDKCCLGLKDKESLKDKETKKCLMFAVLYYTDFNGREKILHIYNINDYKPCYKLIEELKERVNIFIKSEKFADDFGFFVDVYFYTSLELYQKLKDILRKNNLLFGDKDFLYKKILSFFGERPLEALRNYIYINYFLAFVYVNAVLLQSGLFSLFTSSNYIKIVAALFLGTLYFAFVFLVSYQMGILTILALVSYISYGFFKFFIDIIKKNLNLSLSLNLDKELDNLFVKLKELARTVLETVLNIAALTFAFLPVYIFLLNFFLFVLATSSTYYFCANYFCGNFYNIPRNAIIELYELILPYPKVAKIKLTEKRKMDKDKKVETTNCLVLSEGTYIHLTDIISIIRENLRKDEFKYRYCKDINEIFKNKQQKNNKNIKCELSIDLLCKSETLTNILFYSVIKYYPEAFSKAKYHVNYSNNNLTIVPLNRSTCSKEDKNQIEKELKELCSMCNDN